MPHPRFTSEEINGRGKAIYDQKLRSKVETPENIGKIITIDIETEDFVIGDNLVETGKLMHARHAGAALFGDRIGYNAVYSIGGRISRTAS